MWEWSRGVMVRGRVVEIGGLIDRELQTLRSTVELALGPGCKLARRG